MQMMFAIAVTVGVSFAVGYSLGSPNVIEQEVTKNVKTEKAEFVAGRGASASGTMEIKHVEAGETSAIGASGAKASGSVRCRE